MWQTWNPTVYLLPKLVETGLRIFNVCGEIIRHVSTIVRASRELLESVRRSCVGRIAFRKYGHIQSLVRFLRLGHGAGAS